MAVWVFLIVGGAWVSVAMDLRYFPSCWFDPWFHLGTSAAGIVLLKPIFHAASAGGRELAKRGRSTPTLPRLETDRLVTTGIYRCTRHPMLFGLALIPPAVALLLGSCFFILVTAPVEMLLIVVLAATAEEWECRKKFGASYRRYAAEVPFFPRSLACYKKLFFS